MANCISQALQSESEEVDTKWEELNQAFSSLNGWIHTGTSHLLSEQLEKERLRSVWCHWLPEKQTHTKPKNHEAHTVHARVCVCIVIQVVWGEARSHTHLSEVTLSAAGMETVLGFVVFLLREATTGEGSTPWRLEDGVRAPPRHGNPRDLCTAFTRESCQETACTQYSIRLKCSRTHGCFCNLNVM